MPERSAKRTLRTVFTAALLFLLPAPGLTQDCSRPPLRLPAAKTGDWFLYRANGMLMRDTVFYRTGEGAGTTVHYYTEKFDEENTAWFLGARTANLANLMISVPDLWAAVGAGVYQSVKAEITLDGKTASVWKITAPAEHPLWSEVWLTDAFSSHGVARMLPGAGEPRLEIEPLAFGNIAEDIPGWIPPPARLERVRPGDWVLFRKADGVLLRETVTAAERKGDDTVVRYRVEATEPNGRTTEYGEQELSALHSRALAMRDFWTFWRHGSVRAETMTVGGREIAVIIAGNADSETLYSDEVSVDGEIGFRYVGPDPDEEHASAAYELVDFGSGEN